MLKAQIRSNIRFSVCAKVPVESCIEILKSIYGQACPCDRTIRHWYERYVDGETSVVDLPRCGRPRIADLDEQILKILEDHPNASTTFIAETLHVDRATVKDRLIKSLQYKQVSVRWVPHLLSLPQKHRRKQEGLELMNLLIKERESKFLRVITLDESWFVYSNHGIKIKIIFVFFPSLSDEHENKLRKRFG